MSCKALIYVANTGSQTVAANSTLDLGSIQRRYGVKCGQPPIDLNGDGITITEPGYYKVEA